MLCVLTLQRLCTSHPANPANMAPPSLFSLEGKGLKLDTAADLTPHISPLLETDDTITAVHLGGNTYGIGACELLGDVLGRQKRLATAKLDDIFTSRLLSEIPDALTRLLNGCRRVSTLQTIDLCDNAFGLNTQAPLVDFLKAHVPLRHLILNNNGLGPKAGALVAEALLELAARKEEARNAVNKDTGVEIPNLETIVCGRNRLENGSMPTWAETIRAHGHHLRSVRMTQNGIRPEGIALLLGQGFRHAPELETLDLQDNTFTATATGVLAEITPQLPALRELGVGDCLLSARGFNKLAAALARGANKHVEVLRLGFNEINAKGVDALARAASDALPALRRVELNGNVFDEDDSAVVALRELLEERKQNVAPDADDELWGLDELDELEEESEPEEEEEEEEQEEERVVKEADAAEGEKVAQEKDTSVDELEATLKETSI